jgi:hypothetical protein
MAHVHNHTACGVGLAASAPGQILAEQGLVEERMAAWSAAEKVSI